MDLYHGHSIFSQKGRGGGRREERKGKGIVKLSPTVGSLLLNSLPILVGTYTGTTGGRI